MNKTLVIVDACCKIKGANIKGRSGKGKSTCAYIIIDENGEEHSNSKYLGEMTPPQAEFEGLVFALDEAVGITRRDIEVRMDSELVVKWMNGQYRMKKPHIRPIYDKAKQLSERFNSIHINHHSRNTEFAKKADKLANEKMKEYE